MGSNKPKVQTDPAQPDGESSDPTQHTDSPLARRDGDWNKSWRKALSFYDYLSKAGWEHIPQFRALVAAIAQSKEARGLTAFTSHAMLVISPYTRYPDWFMGRRVYLEPLADANVCIVWHFERKSTTWTLSLDEARSKALTLLADL